METTIKQDKSKLLIEEPEWVQILKRLCEEVKIKKEKGKCEA